MHGMPCRQLCRLFERANRRKFVGSLPDLLCSTAKISGKSTLPGSPFCATLKRSGWSFGRIGGSRAIATDAKGTDGVGTHVDLVDAAAMLYLQCADGVDYLNFIERYNMQDTFMSWFKVSVLHIWLVLLRLSGTATVQAVVKQEMVYCLWDDVDGRLQKLKRISPSVSLKRRETLGQCYGLLLISFCEYDEGILGDDKTLAGALWRNMYNRELDDPVVLSSLVRYVRFQARSLHGIPTELMLSEGVKQWQTLS